LELHDKEEAEKYCLNQFPVVEPDDFYNNPMRSELFLITLRLCIETEDSKHLQFCIYLLNKYHKYINPMKVLKIIRGFVPISYLSHYLVQSMKTVQNTQRNSKIFRKMSKVEKWQVAGDLGELQNRKIVLKESTKCTECGKVIGNSVFSVFPDLQVTHLYCMEKRKKRENMK
jgi:hypothetical protein